MKKVLVVITTAFVPTGGLTSVMMNYYRELDRGNLQIDFASTNKAPDILLDELTKNRSRYFCLGKRKYVIQYFIKLYRLCKDYDIVHVNGNSATTAIEHLAAKLAGVESRINHNHNSFSEHKTLSDILYLFFTHLVTKKVSCSDLAGNWLYGKGNFLILRNAIDVEKYHYDSMMRKLKRKEFGIEDNWIVLGHVGKINKQKNHPYLVRIFAEYHKLNSNSKLFLVGDGVMRQDVESLVDELNLCDNVIFAGLRTDIPEMLQIMDYFIFPSIWEGMPLSVLEALSSGLTCIISDHITKDVMIGSHIHSMAIEKEPMEWAKYINDYQLPMRMDACNESANAITEAGYNIKTEAGKLREIYLK